MTTHLFTVDPREQGEVVLMKYLRINDAQFSAMLLLGLPIGLVGESPLSVIAYGTGGVLVYYCLAVVSNIVLGAVA